MKSWSVAVCKRWSGFCFIVITDGGGGGGATVVSGLAASGVKVAAIVRVLPSCSSVDPAVLSTVPFVAKEDGDTAAPYCRRRSKRNAPSAARPGPPAHLLLPPPRELSPSHCEKREGQPVHETDDGANQQALNACPTVAAAVTSIPSATSAFVRAAPPLLFLAPPPAPAPASCAVAAATTSTAATPPVAIAFVAQSDLTFVLSPSPSSASDSLPFDGRTE